MYDILVRGEITKIWQNRIMMLLYSEADRWLGLGMIGIERDSRVCEEKVVQIEVEIPIQYCVNFEIFDEMVQNFIWLYF